MHQRIGINEMKTLNSHSTTVIAQQRFGHWLVWFEHSPNARYAGESFYLAVTHLLDSTGWDRNLLERSDVQFASNANCSQVSISIAEFAAGKRP